MKHKIKGRKLGRNSASRKSLFRNLAISLLKYKVIKTTLPKAKELRPFFERIVTISKTDNLANRRLALSLLSNKEAVKELFNVVSKVVKSRPGGYVRILKNGFRTGDKAPMAIIEFVDTAFFESKHDNTKNIVKTIKEVNKI